MKRFVSFTAAVALACATAACSGDRSTDANRATGTGGAVGTTGAANADRDFVQKQLAMGTAEIELGRLAQQKAMNADVKEYGAMMVRDHQQAADELKPIATRVNATESSASR